MKSNGALGQITGIPPTKIAPATATMRSGIGSVTISKEVQEVQYQITFHMVDSWM
jgi:hypothetical protein